MHPRAQELIQSLALQPHPEGGYYREIFRSALQVQPADDRASRAALTSIYFLLVQNTFSRWHAVRSDEVWHFYEGDPLELFLVSPDFKVRENHRLGANGKGQQPIRAVPAGWWQAARPAGPYALVGCSVAPGFEFADFSFLSASPQAAANLNRLAPQWMDLA